MFQLILVNSLWKNKWRGDVLQRNKRHQRVMELVHRNGDVSTQIQIFAFLCVGMSWFRKFAFLSTNTKNCFLEVATSKVDGMCIICLKRMKIWFCIYFNSLMVKAVVSRLEKFSFSWKSFMFYSVH